ncbi:MAG: SbcC/MukB-like Walker B domain-containing protein [Rubrivivax sp.]
MDQTALFEAVPLAAPGAPRVPAEVHEDDRRPQWSERDLDEAAQRQFRLKQIQVMNWGTFSKLHVLDISALGHLLVGPSGSGKSTILDAHSALMAPPNSEFNAAARGNDKLARDRNMVSYIRGAWATNESDGGIIASQYLRDDTTMSAVAEVYESGGGQLLTLVGLWWIKGKSTLAKDVHSCYLVVERSFSLKELVFFMADYNVRAFAKYLPDITPPFSTHSAFRERFKARLGIDHDLALRLLHRTQSSKNLGDINAFMRDNMLDEPETFGIAKNLCEDFTTLAAAHADVVDAREQRNLLLKADTEHRDYEAANAEVAHAIQLLSQADHQRDHLLFQLKGERAAELEVELEGQRQAAKAQNHELSLREEELEQLRRERAGMDDGNAANLKQQLETRTTLLVTVGKARARALGWLRTLGWTEPTSAVHFGERVGAAKQMAERGENKDDDGQVDKLRRKVFEADTRLDELVPELESLGKRSSNLSDKLILVRDRLAAALRISPSRLPFAGELLNVRESESRWQGALERLLGPLANSFLVPEAHYGAVVDWLEETQTGQHVRYLRMRSHDRRPLEGPKAPSRFLDCAEGDYGHWIRDEILEHYGDYVCTDSTQEFAAADRALSLQGQIKRGRTRHEKNDRDRIDNRLTWAIGFSNEHKKLDIVREIGEWNDAKTDATAALRRIEEKRAKEREKLNAATLLSQVTWDEVDEVGAGQTVAGLVEQIRLATEAHPEVGDTDRRIDAKEKVVKEARGACTAAEQLRDATARQIAALKEARENTPEEIRHPPDLEADLLPLFERGAAITLENLEGKRARVREALADKRGDAREKALLCKNKLEGVLSTFKRVHQKAAADMGTTLEDWPEYARVLEKIVADDLPRFEDHFFRLLNEQSDRHLAKLQQRLTTERDEIRNRMNIVNDALGQSPFNPGTYLLIKDKPRTLPEVADFRAELRACLERNFKTEASREEREAQFEALHGIVKRLQGERPEDERWRALVLDVRQHVEFLAKEYDEAGEVKDIYQSGAGKSGGQRQKLAATCLAAALRYQLAGTDRPLPQFCTVLMDEAFDKADSDFTAMTLNIFNTFGFQMLMATPMKAVRTLEPFIGGAHVFSNKSRSSSGVVSIEYDMTTRRLVGLGGQGGVQVAGQSEPSGAAIQRD